MDPINTVTRALLLLSATAALLVSPVDTVSSPIGNGEACADGSCCRSPGNYCEHLGHEHYNYDYHADGCEAEE